MEFARVLPSLLFFLLMIHILPGNPSNGTALGSGEGTAGLSRTCGGYPTPTTQLLTFDDLTVSKSVLPLQTPSFTYQDDFHLSGVPTLAFVNCSLFYNKSIERKACSSGTAALLSNGDTVAITFAAHGQNSSYFRWFNLSSMSLTNLMDQNILVTYYPVIVSGRETTFNASGKSLTHSLARGTSKQLVQGFRSIGFSFLQGFSFDAVVDEDRNSTKKIASFAIDDIAIVRPYTVPCTTSIPTPTRSVCAKTATAYCKKCTPVSSTVINETLKFNDINTQGANMSVPNHYAGYSFPKKLQILGAVSALKGPRPYGSQRRPGSNALYGQPHESDDSYSGYSVSFGAEQFNLFSVESFYITVLNISDPKTIPKRPATIHLRTWAPRGRSFIPNPDLTFTIPAGKELFRFARTSDQASLRNIAEFNIKALFDDSAEEQAGVMILDMTTSHIAYAKVPKECDDLLDSLSFDDIDTSSGHGNIYAPEFHQGFRLRSPTLVSNELAPWNVTEGPVYDSGPGAQSSRKSARNILLANVTVPFDEARRVSLTNDEDFDPTSLILGISENGSRFSLINIYGFNKCGDLVGTLNRSAVAYPGDGAVLNIGTGAFTEAGLLGIRSLGFDVFSPTGDPRGVVRSVPFWIDNLKYRPSRSIGSCEFTMNRDPKD